MNVSLKFTAVLAMTIVVIAFPAACATTALAGGAPASVATAAAAPQPSSKTDAPAAASLQPLAFLLGDWEATGQGKPGQSAGHAIFRQDLQERVMIRTSFAKYPASGDRPASRHDDLMVIYADGAALGADYYDSEGHVIRYAVATPTTDAAVLTSDAAAAQPRYRLSYALRPGDVLEGTFEIAPPGKPDAFQRYLTWQSHKAGSKSASQ